LINFLFRGFTLIFADKTRKGKSPDPRKSV